MSIVLKLQKKCINPNESLENLLREAYLISSKLKLEDFKTWINFELNGYENHCDAPKYRRVDHTLSFFNPYTGWYEAIIPEDWDDLASSNSVQPIGELEDLVNNYKEENGITMYIAPHRIKVLHEVYETSFQPRISISKTQLLGIIQKVRNLLLEWTIKLEEDGILGNDDLVFSEVEKVAAKHIHIENFTGVMGDIDKIGILSNGDNAKNTYIENNIESKIDELINEIKALKISGNDSIITDLEEAKHDQNKRTKVLGTVISKFSEFASITSLGISILGMLAK